MTRALKTLTPTLSRLAGEGARTARQAQHRQAGRKWRCAPPLSLWERVGVRAGSRQPR